MNITENWAMSQAVTQFCSQHGIMYELFSDGWVLRLTKADERRLVIGLAWDYNSQAAAAVATDKVAAYQLLSAANVSTVEHYLIKAISDAELNMATLQQLFSQHDSLVLKPLRGGHGKHVGRFASAEAAHTFSQVHPEDDWTASPYVDIQRELRLVLLDGETIMAYEKSDPPLINNLRMFNLNHGATPLDIELGALGPDLPMLARDAMAAIGLSLGAVDIVIDASGAAKVLEINASFSLERYAASGPQRRQRVVAAYTRVLEAIF